MRHHLGNSKLNFKNRPVNEVYYKTKRNRFEASANQMATSNTAKDKITIYGKHTFLTCRSPTDSFYLCQTLDDVYDDATQVRIQWYSFVDENHDENDIDEKTHFKLSYQDVLDIHTILAEIPSVITHPHQRVTLKKKDITRTRHLLKESIKAESNQTADGARVNQRRKREATGEGNAAPVRKRRRTTEINEIETKRTVLSKAGLFKVQSNRFLKENQHVTEYEADPFFESNSPVPFISATVQSKLAIRAVLLNDGELLKSLMEDADRICSVHIRRDFPKSPSAIHYATQKNDLHLFEILAEDLLKSKKNRKQTGGEYDGRHRTREGNNAFFKDTEQIVSLSQNMEILEYAVQHHCSLEMYNAMWAKFSFPNIVDCVHLCIGHGRQDLATATLEKMQQRGRYGFQPLHYQMLKFNDEELTVKRAYDVTRKTKDAYQITPIHCAAINPNVKYLKQLVAIASDLNTLDKQNRRPIHYAALCAGTDPLKYLLSQDVPLNVVDKKGNTPLHIAVRCGRTSNAEALLRKAKEKAELNDLENQLEHEKYGLASINLMNTLHQYPLHLAVLHARLECVQLLLDYGAQVDAFTGIPSEKLTALMMACQIGSLDIVKCLIKNGARVEARDRFQRTALIHASMYGHAHVVSYLLRIGANSNAFDSSKNTSLHYAIAYGWYFCVRLLMEAGASVNAVNYVHMTCLRIGLLKGNYGICDYLLNEHHADINFKTADGLTIVMHTVKSTISKTVLQQLEYVVIKYNADCTGTDKNGQNAFHYLASHTDAQNSSLLSEMSEKELQSTYFRLGEVLLQHVCNPVQMDNRAQTPLMVALNAGNAFVVDFLINQSKLELTLDVSRDGRTLLHYFAMNSENSKLVDILVKLSVVDDLKKMLDVFDNEGRTPFHHCTKKYEENFRMRHDTDAARPQYQSIIRMIRFFLETLDCDPDIPSSDGGASIFDLLYDPSYCGSASEHPLHILLQRSKNINVPLLETGRTPLLQAIDAQHSRAVRLLLQNPACNVNLAASKTTSELGKTPLILACQLHYLPIIRELINHPQCDLLACDNQQNQALHYFLATSQRSDEFLEIFHIFVKKLLVLGKHTLNSPGVIGRVPLHIAVQYNVGTTNTVEEVLVENDSDVFVKDELGNMPLHHVFLGKKSTIDPSELCAYMMQAMNYQSLDTKNNEGKTPLHLAAMNDSTICVTLLLNHKANLLIEDNLSNSVIATSIARKRFNLVIAFLQHPIDIDLSRHYHTAPTISDSDTKNKILEEDSLISLIIKDRNWQRMVPIILDDLPRFHLNNLQVLDAMITNGQFDLALRLLAKIKDGTSLNERNAHGRNLFHIVALSRTSDGPFVKKVLTGLHHNHVDWNVADQYGMYPLHYACISHNQTFIEFLLEKYSDLVDFNQMDQYGNTAYGLLFWYSATKSCVNESFLQSIIKSGSALDCLCSYENRQARNPLSLYHLKKLSEAPVIPKTPFEVEDLSTLIRTTPLINAIIHNKTDLVKVLLKFGADVHQVDEAHQTPLMHAVRQNNIETVRLLLDNSGQFRDEQPNVRGKAHEEQISAATAIGSRIDQTDALGRTCIHHLVQPFPESYHASYMNNIELLELLHSAGASLTRPDQMGFTPLAYAAKHHGCQHLYHKLKELTNEHRMSMDDETPPQRVVVNDPNESLRGLVDYYSDAQQYINEYITAHRMENATSVYKVDPLSNMSETGEIVIDEQSNEPFDVRLTITDVDQGLIGLYNFYRIQIIKHRTKTGLYLLFTRWGRVGGGDGEHQLTPHPSFDACLTEFYKIFLEKTGNNWENADRFQQQPKKYTVVQLKNSPTCKVTDVPIDFQRLSDETQHVPSQLQSETYKAFFRMFLTSETIHTNMKKAELDVEWMPVSQLKPESLKKARDILATLKIYIERKDKLKLTIQQRLADEGCNGQTAESPEHAEFQRLLDSICQLTNDYYSIVPLQGYGSEKLRVIDTAAALRAQAQKLDDILELELSYKIVLAAQANLNRMSPLDYLYKSINCQLESLHRDDLDSQLILRYIWASSPSTKVDHIFRVKRANDDDEQILQRNLDSRYLLWHGTHMCNLIGILIRGLLVEPLCAKSTGRLFGTGIYTTDAFVKSLAYCSGVNQNGSEYGCMLLCEVALGHCHDIIDRHHSAQTTPLDTSVYQSRKAHGSSIPDPRHSIVRDSGVRIPLGEVITCKDPQHSSHACTHNEYIVTDASQVIIRYIVQFRQ